MELNKESILNEYFCKILELPGNCVISDMKGRIYVLGGEQFLELATVYHNHLDKAQVRIKELEEGLRFYATRGNIDWTGEDEPWEVYDDIQFAPGHFAGSVGNLGDLARKYLEKESE